jgi:hypothetical protein
MKRSAHRDAAANNARMNATRGADGSVVGLIGGVQDGTHSSSYGKARAKCPLSPRPVGARQEGMGAEPTGRECMQYDERRTIHNPP